MPRMQAYIMKYILSAILLVCTSALSFACSTPVFQYAIERWSPDPFIIRVYHTQDLTEQEQKIIDDFNKHLSEFLEVEPYVIETVDVRNIEDKKDLALAQKHTKDKSTALTALFPVYENNPEPFFSKALTAKTKDELLNSPLRTDLYKRLTGGHSFVWLFIECEDKEKNAKALKTLQKTIKDYVPQLQNDINERLGGNEFEDSGEELEDGTLDLGIPKVHSSIIALKKGDAKEQVFYTMLTRNDDELTKSQDPIAIPIFGQGRALWPLMGKGIDKELIIESMIFLSGSCSCQIKDQNPGYDIFLNVDWAEALENRTTGQIMTTKVITPETSPIPNQQPTQSEADNKDTKSNNDYPLYLYIVLGAVVLIIVILALSAGSKNKQ